jgi:hypothetical protein
MEINTENIHNKKKMKMKNREMGSTDKKEKKSSPQ